VANERPSFEDLSPKQQAKFKTVMKEYAAGSLHHGGTGKIVKDRKVAVAVAFSKAREVKG